MNEDDEWFIVDYVKCGEEQDELFKLSKMPEVQTWCAWIKYVTNNEKVLINHTQVFIQKGCVNDLLHLFLKDLSNFFCHLASSDTAPLHPGGPGFSHSALLRGWPLRHHHDCWGSGHHVCIEERHIHGEDASTGPAETTDPHCESVRSINHYWVWCQEAAAFQSNLSLSSWVQHWLAPTLWLFLWSLCVLWSL